jgi:hypothetical protein
MSFRRPDYPAPKVADRLGIELVAANEKEDEALEAGVKVQPDGMNQESRKAGKGEKATANAADPDLEQFLEPYRDEFVEAFAGDLQPLRDALEHIVQSPNEELQRQNMIVLRGQLGSILSQINRAPKTASVLADLMEAAFERGWNEAGQLRLSTANYDPDQPRDPAGSPEGGEWSAYSGAYSSREAEAAEIERGRRAMDAVIATKADQFDAMERPGLGSVDFRWGTPGGGIRHIIEKRDREGRERQSLRGQSGEDVARRMPEVIAKGNLGAPYADRNGRKRNVEYEGYRAVLALEFQRKRRAWLLTGFEKP